MLLLPARYTFGREIIGGTVGSLRYIVSSSRMTLLIIFARSWPVCSTYRELPAVAMATIALDRQVPSKGRRLARVGDDNDFLALAAAWDRKQLRALILIERG